MTLAEEWMRDKKKTHWRVWECVSTDYADDTWQWVLFFVDDDKDIKATYEYGLGLTPEECETSIREAITVRLRNLNLL